jgi:hypothetical protein
MIVYIIITAAVLSIRVRVDFIAALDL